MTAGEGQQRVAKKRISDLITDVVNDDSDASFERLLAALPAAMFGLEVAGISPDVAPGARVDAGGTQLPQVSTPDGRRWVRACADPAEFAVRFPETEITAQIDGLELLRMVNRIEQCDGVLICSARSFHSVPIDKEIIRDLVESE